MRDQNALTLTPRPPATPTPQQRPTTHRPAACSPSLSPTTPRVFNPRGAQHRGGIWRAYEMKEQFRAIFAGDLPPTTAIALLDRWCARAQRSRLPAFIKAARTMRARRGLIVNALEQGISNGRVEGLNTKVRLLIRRAFGFHSADAALALVMLACGPITLTLPHERPALQAAS